MYHYKRIRLNRNQTRDEHRIVMERHLGRILERDACVHHKDGNKRNNCLSNLEVIDRAEHMRLHIKSGEIRRGEFTKEEREKACAQFSVVDESLARDIKYSSLSPRHYLESMGISKFVVHRIRSGKSWKHI